MTDWDWEGADGGYSRALDLEPSNTHVHHEYSDFLVISGRVDEGLALGRRAVQTAPLDLDRRQHLCWLHYIARRYDLALAECERIVAEHPDFAKPYQYLSFIHDALGDRGASYSSMQRFFRLAGFPEPLIGAMQEGYGHSGLSGAHRALALWTEAHSYAGSAAWYWAAAGDYERSIVALEELPQDDPQVLTVAPVVHSFDPLHSEPRFQSLLRRINHPRAL